MVMKIILPAIGFVHRRRTGPFWSILMRGIRAASTQCYVVFSRQLCGALLFPCQAWQSGCLGDLLRLCRSRKFNMAPSACVCPLCWRPASASSQDNGNAARVYCPNCRSFEITRLAHKKLSNRSPSEVADLARYAADAHPLRVLFICSDKLYLQLRCTSRENGAPKWLASDA